MEKFGPRSVASPKQKEQLAAADKLLKGADQKVDKKVPYPDRLAEITEYYILGKKILGRPLEWNVPRLDFQVAAKSTAPITDCPEELILEGPASTAPHQDIQLWAYVYYSIYPMAYTTWQSLSVRQRLSYLTALLEITPTRCKWRCFVGFCRRWWSILTFQGDPWSGCDL